LAVYVVWNLVRGLCQAHQARGPDGQPLQLVHRDVSPGNVLLAKDGSVKLADFGVAKAVGRMTQTAAGVLKGKMEYMAPETLEVGLCDQRADIYCAGIVLWEALTTRRLFCGDQPSVVSNLMRHSIEPPSQYNPSVPPVLDALTLKILSPRPEDRPQTARELEQAIFALLGGSSPENLAQEFSAHVSAFGKTRGDDEIAALARPGDSTQPTAETPAAVNAPGPVLPAAAGSPSQARGEEDFFSLGGAAAAAPLAESTSAKKPQAAWRGKPESADFFSPLATQSGPPREPQKFVVAWSGGVEQLSATGVWRALTADEPHEPWRVGVTEGHELDTPQLGRLLMLDRLTPLSSLSGRAVVRTRMDDAQLRALLAQCRVEEHTGAITVLGEKRGQTAALFLQKGRPAYVYAPSLTDTFIQTALLNWNLDSVLGPVLQRVIVHRGMVWETLLDANLMTRQNVCAALEHLAALRLNAVLSWRTVQCSMVPELEAPYRLP
jgi:hypothetical protein